MTVKGDFKKYADQRLRKEYFLNNSIKVESGLFRGNVGCIDSLWNTVIDSNCHNKISFCFLKITHGHEEAINAF